MQKAKTLLFLRYLWFLLTAFNTSPLQIEVVSANIWYHLTSIALPHYLT